MNAKVTPYHIGLIDITLLRVLLPFLRVSMFHQQHLDKYDMHSVLNQWRIQWRMKAGSQCVPLQWRHNETMASQITNVSIVCSSVCLGADQRQHQSSATLAFVRGIHRSPVIHRWIPFVKGQ